jgi:hypothetical protein
MAKKNKRSGQVGQGAQYWFRRILADAKNAHELVSIARVQSQVSSYSSLISLVKQSPYASRDIFNPEYPKRYDRLRVTRPLAPIDLDREFRWAGAYLSRHVAKLAKFIEVSNRFERALLLDAETECRQLLASVEEEFGVSLWLIKNKLIFLQASGGLDAQKRYLNEIFMEVGNYGVIPFIAYYASVRNEGSVTFHGFANQFEQELAEYRITSDLETYLRYHILPGRLLTRDQIANLLRHEQASPVIDYYESLVRVVQETIRADYWDLYPTVVDTLRELKDSVCDRRFTIPLIEMDSGHTIKQLETECTDLNCLDYFLRGDYERALATSLDSLNQRPDQFDVLEIAAKSAALLSEQALNDERPLINRIISRMRSVISKEPTVNAALVDLLKLSLNHDSFAWARGLRAFTRKEASPDPLGPNSQSEHFAAAASPYLNPLRISAFPTEATRKKYSVLTEQCTGSSLTVSYGRVLAGYEVTNGALQDLVEEEQALLKAEVALRVGDFERAHSAADMLATSPNRYYQHRFIRLKAFCLLRLGHLEECAKFVTSAYVPEHNLHYILPIKDLVEIIDEGTRELLAKDISIPILYDMYSKYVGGKYEPQRKYAAEDFLDRHGLVRPSEVRAIMDKFPLEKLTYYLRYVCVEAVMDNFTSFKYSWEVAEERLAVCRLLVELDVQNADAYQTEIRELLRRLMIQKRMREVEQSKIYVDIDSIRNAAEKSLRESFNRYMAFRRYRYDETLSAIFDVLNKLNVKPDRQLVLFAFPDQEITRILVGIIQELRDQYVSSKHGLDGYLSVRVRHGTLTNHLRNPLEAHHLVTQKKDAITNEYTRNEYWIQRLSITDLDLQEALEKRLAQFSHDFDQLVKMILSEWIQVKKDHAGTGLFDFAIDEELVNTVANSVTADATFEQFLDTVFQIFGEVLSRNLRTVRAKIEAEAKPQFSELLTVLQTDVEKLLRYRYYLYANDLTNAIRASRTDMQVAIDRIAAWFRLSKSTANEPFDIEDAVNIGMESLRTSSHGFDASITVEGRDNRVEIGGRQLTNFVDIFFTAFENVVRHSHTDGQPRAEVRITYYEGAIHFLIENEVGPRTVNTESLNKLEAIKSAIQGERYVKSLATEGGTGLHKIWKIIAYDFRNRTPCMDFGFRGKERFYIEFVVYTKEVMK